MPPNSEFVVSICCVITEMSCCGIKMHNCIWQATECLIELGADVNIGEGSSTPLYVAVCSEREDVVRLIIKQVHFFTAWLDAFEMNSLPNNKILGLPKLKAFADDKINVTQKLKFALGRGRKHCGKRKKMLVTSIFSFSHNVFTS